jgi:hypothetical protein
MKLPPKALLGIALYVLGIAILMWSRLLPPSPLKGWLTMLGFGVGAVPLIFALITQRNRRRSLAFGVSFVLFGMYFGLPFIWAARPSWLQPVVLAGLFLTGAWGFREGMLANRASRDSA